MYSVILTTASFRYRGVLLGKMPFVVDGQGFPMDVVNKYLMSFAMEHRNVEKTIFPKAKGIILILNKLKKQVIEKEETNNTTKIDRNYIWKNVRESNLHKVLNDFTIRYKSGTYQINDSNEKAFRAFHAFLWWAEEQGHCTNVIGINSGGKGNQFRVPVKPFKGKNRLINYSIPGLEGIKTLKGPPRVRGNPSMWDKAEKNASLGDPEKTDLNSIALNHRNELFIRTVRLTGMRRIEVCFLTTEQFNKDPLPGETRVFIQLGVTKIYAARQQGIPVDLYYEIKDYISSSRILLMKEHKESKALFPSNSTGDFMKPTSISNLFKKLGITPQDGRSLCLTELFIEKIERGLDEQTATILVAQEAGHSIKSQGETLRRHYLVAREIVASKGWLSNSELKKSNAELEKSNADKQMTIEQQAAEIENLKEQLDKLK